MKLAYLCEPQAGGTFTFFLRLRDGLRGSGHEVSCIPPITAARFAGTRFAAIEGVDYLDLPDDLAAATRVLLDHLQAGRFDAVMILPGCDLLTTNLLRYLPRQLRTLARIPMATRGACRPAAAMAAHLDVIVAVCDRIRDDLVADYGVDPAHVSVAYNGADVSLFAAGEPRPRCELLQVLYSGRLEDVQKNVLLLPRIARLLRERGVRARFTVAGSGPDRDALTGAIARAGVMDDFALRPAVAHAELPALYRAADVFVLPTRFEGCPNALLEAMACGCVPVVSDLRGSLDRVVEQGVSGFLCRVDDAPAFAERIAQVAADPVLRMTLRAGALARIAASFEVRHMVARYRALLDGLGARPDQRPPALPLSDYAIPRDLRRGWRAYIPDPVKKQVRTLLGRWGKSV